MRSGPDAPAQRVIVLTTLGAPERRRLRRSRRRPVVSDAEPTPVPTARVTVVDAEPFAGEPAAGAWLESLRRDKEALGREVAEGVAVLNRVLSAYRTAVADPYARGIKEEQALVRRAGYGAGVLVADGRFTAAVELPPTGTGRRSRSKRLQEQEQLAAVLGGRERPLASEELVLRARLDLREGRPREAALQARIALEAMLAELGSESSIGRSLDDLRGRRDSVARAANAALEAPPEEALRVEVAEAVERMEATLARRRAAPR